MLSASEVARYLLSLVDEEKGQVISNLALQKLLYYCQGYYLGLKKEKLFEEEVVAWKYGPVVPAVYEEYNRYGSNPLPVPTIEDEELNGLDTEQKEIMDTVFEFYKDYSAIGLMRKTHKETPWRDTPLNKTISTEKMIEFFRGKVKR
jgi:uncharacterized phage-associated protein